MGKEAKTNAMRMLERAKVPYTPHEYPHEEGQAVDGATVARLTGQDPARVFKTLVTQGADHAYYVFVVPVLAELDLKKAARAVGAKSVAMLHVADLNRVTGYVRGGCSPVGMKKQFVTVFDASCLRQPTILVSGGRIGTQVEAEPAGLVRAVRGLTAQITAEKAAEAENAGYGEKADDLTPESKKSEPQAAGENP
jgi:Cys-tRNA(Pro)/Cys-tRNA(Cys) deacylase